MSATPPLADKRLLAAVKARRGDTSTTEQFAANLNERGLNRACLTDKIDMPADDWHRLAGGTLNRWADGEAKNHENLWIATRLPMMSNEEREGAIKALVGGIPVPAEAARLLASLSPAALERAVTWQQTDPRNTPANVGALALRTVAALGKKAPDWISRYEALAEPGKAHDGAYWLPLANENTADLVRFLTQVTVAGIEPDKALEKIRKAVSSWENLAPKVKEAYKEGLEPTLSDAMTWRKAAKAPAAADGTFANDWVEAEAGGWGRYSEAAVLLVNSHQVPRAPVPRRLYTHDGYTASFLDRSDPVGILLGELTECCQHLGGAAQWCVYHGQADPHGSFFAVRDGNGRVVAQSWVWFNSKGLCFDNIELLEPEEDDQNYDRLEVRRERVRRLYEQAAADLAPRFGRITVGEGYTDEAITRDWAQTKATPLKNLRYSDARRQRLLADGEVSGMTWDLEGNLIFAGTRLFNASRKLVGGQALTTVTLAEGVQLDQVLDLVGDVAGMDTTIVYSHDGALIAEMEGDPISHLGVSLGSDWQAVIQAIGNAEKIPLENMFVGEGYQQSDITGVTGQLGWQKYVLGLVATNMTIGDVIALAALYSVEFMRLLDALSGGLTVSELEDASKKGVEIIDLLAARTFGVSLDELVACYNQGLARERVVDSKQDGIAPVRLLEILNNPHYRTARFSWGTRRTSANPDELSAGAVWSRVALRAFNSLEALGFTGPEISKLAADYPDFAAELPKMASRKPTLEKLTEVLEVLRRNEDEYMRRHQTWVVVPLALAAFKQDAKALDVAMKSFDNVSHLAFFCRNNISLTFATRLAVSKINLDYMIKLVELRVKEEDLEKLVDRKAPLRKVVMAVRNGAEIDQVYKALDDKTPLEILAQASRTGSTVDQIQQLDELRGDTSLARLANLVARGATPQQAATLAASGQFTNVYEAIQAGHKSGYSYPDYLKLKSIGMTNTQIYESWSLLAPANDRTSSEVTARLLEAHALVPGEQPLEIALLRQRNVPDATVTQLLEEGSLDRVLGGMVTPKINRKPTFTLSQCQLLIDAGLDPAEYTPLLQWKGHSAGATARIVVKFHETGQDEHKPPRARSMYYGYQNTKAQESLDLAYAMCMIPERMLLEILEMPQPWTETVAAMEKNYHSVPVDPDTESPRDKYARALTWRRASLEEVTKAYNMFKEALTSEAPGVGPEHKVKSAPKKADRKKDKQHKR